MIKRCGCTGDKFNNTAGADYQDKNYGKGNRVHTHSKESKISRCSVCGKENRNDSK